MLMLFCVTSAVSAQIKAGDFYIFGQYEQDNDPSNGPEPIMWKVLAVESDRLLVISRYGLDAKPYNTSNTDVTWETCSLREWLNGEFFSSAFSESEQERINPVTLKNPDNPDHGTPGGNDTTDRIFLLTAEEANRYLSEKARQCKPTAYAEANGAGVNNDNGFSWWWLRLPGFAPYSAAYVGISGNTIPFGDYVDHTDAVVRPAFWMTPAPSAAPTPTAAPIPTAAPTPTAQGNPAEMAILGENAYWEGDYETALQYLVPAAEAGDADAQFRLGFMYLQGEGVPQDMEKAAYYTAKAADQGNVNAQTNMGKMYAEGIGVPQSYVNAAKYYQMAAEQGDDRAQNNLGKLYDDGNGVGQSSEQALYYYNLAAEQNNPYAQSNLGVLYYFGRGTAQSYEKALEYFLMAAEQGNAYAQFAAGWMYEHGEGTEKDIQTAVLYYRLAAEQGYQDAADRLDAFLL